MSAPPPPRHFSFTKPDGTLKTAAEVQAEANKLVAEAQQRATHLKTELAANTAEATSRNQAATVSVSAAGALQNVRLTDRVKTMTPPQIAASVLEAYQQAARQVAARTLEITAAEGSPRVTAMMRDLLPSYARPDEEA
jgi:DNA-binding protein YbaB